MFTGCGTAMVTPFRRDGALDEATLIRLIHRQIEAGIDFLVPCGTTGESPTLSREEHLRVVELTVDVAKGKVPVLAGAGGYNTAEVIALAREVGCHWRRRHSFCHAVLQQADPGRSLPALSRDRERYDLAHYSLQRGGTNWREH